MCNRFVIGFINLLGSETYKAVDSTEKSCFLLKEHCILIFDRLKTNLLRGSGVDRGHPSFHLFIFELLILVRFRMPTGRAVQSTVLFPNDRLFPRDS